MTNTIPWTTGAEFDEWLKKVFGEFEELESEIPWTTGTEFDEWLKKIF